MLCKLEAESPLATSSIRRLIKRTTERAGLDPNLTADPSGHSICMSNGSNAARRQSPEILSIRGFENSDVPTSSRHAEASELQQGG